MGDSTELVDASAERLDPRAFGSVLSALGRSGSVDLLPTPALICELTILDANIAKLQALVATTGLSLRPHAKSHKSSFVAERQLAAGAVGICCAKVSEAEAIVERLDGVDQLKVLLTSPTASRAAAARIALLARKVDVTVAVDDVDAVTDLSLAASNAETNIGVVCDVDVGLGRTGVASAADAVRIAAQTSESKSLRFVGLQGYAGHVQHVAPRTERESAASKSAGRLSEASSAVQRAGLPVGIVTGGGTGTWMIDAADGVLTEIQAGSYIFMDRDYRDALAGDPEDCFEQSLFVLTTVISANQREFVTVDAGLKSMATDSGPAVLDSGRGTYAFFGDEQGLVTRESTEDLVRGTRIRLVPPHCDPTVNLYDHMWLVDGDRVIGVVAVIARGRSY